jgi:NAD(P)-dependent dehydrogenase (short-subunit alcohol dehydrogenase family)
MKSAIVTGVSRGLGEALGLELLSRGFEVTGIGRRNSSRLAGEHYRFTPCNLANAEAIDSTVEPVLRAIADTRPASVCLINNAATAEPVGVIGAINGAGIAVSLAANLVAPLALSNLFCRIFADAAQERRVINVSSGAAQSALPGGGLYSIAKAGLEMLTKQLAAEHGPSSLKAISVRPGIIDTPMQQFMRSQSRDVLPSVAMFQDFHASGQLVAADVVAAKIVDKLVLGEIEQGRTYLYKEL